MEAKKVILSFDVDDGLRVGIDRVRAILGFSEGDGIRVTTVLGDKTGVSLNGGSAVIYFSKKHLFFRELGILVEKAAVCESFELFEDDFFDTLSVMIDTSRCAVPTVATINRMMDYLAIMGYGMAMLYTEDLIELERFKADVDILLRLAYQVRRNPNVCTVGSFESHLDSVVASAQSLKDDIRIVR